MSCFELPMKSIILIIFMNLLATYEIHHIIIVFFLLLLLQQKKGREEEKDC